MGLDGRFAKKLAVILVLQWGLPSGVFIGDKLRHEAQGFLN
jgi:hypothetical protein